MEKTYTCKQICKYTQKQNGVKTPEKSRNATGEDTKYRKAPIDCPNPWDQIFSFYRDDFDTYREKHAHKKC
jgi:hypothetical protein